MRIDVRHVAPLALLLASRAASQYLHHSASPYGPWEPVIPPGCNESTGVWPAIYANQTGAWRYTSGGNNPTPYLIDDEVSNVTGFDAGTVVIITTGGRGGRFAVGIAKSWRHPVILDPRPLFSLPYLNEGANISVKTRPWDGWSYEDPYLYFDKRTQRWRALFHQMRHRVPAGEKVPESVDIHAGGYAESLTPKLWGPWAVRSPQYGAYTKEIELASWTSRSALGDVGGPQAPFAFGRTTIAYQNDSLTTWGGNVVEDDHGMYHLFVAAFVGPRPGPCSIGTWEQNSMVIHAVSPTPQGPFNMSDVALPVWHHNPHVMRDPASGEYLLYSIGFVNTTGQLCGYGACKSCRAYPHQCGQLPCDTPSRFPTLRPGSLTLFRRERPKLLLDRSGRPTHMYNSADLLSNGQDRPFTIVTEIMDAAPMVV